MLFIIFGSGADYGKIRMNDILKEKNVQFIEPILFKKDKKLEYLYKLHHSIIWFGCHNDTLSVTQIARPVFVADSVKSSTPFD